MDVTLTERKHEDDFHLRDLLWERMALLLPAPKAHPLKCHRPRVSNRAAMDAILFEPVILGRRNEQKNKRQRGARAQRWLVERTHSWLESVSPVADAMGESMKTLTSPCCSSLTH